MHTYKTSELAAIFGVHPNTVRLYEALDLIPRARRAENGYRAFTDLHIRLFRLARTAFEIEVLQNGLRKKATQVIKTAALGDLDRALALADDYLCQVRQERQNAEQAILIAQNLLPGAAQAQQVKRSEAAAMLGISMDAMRNWEMNGLVTVRRRENGYRVYNGADLNRLRVIRALRCAGYSLEAILRMLNALEQNPRADVRAALNTPAPEEDVVSVCDRLLTSLGAAEENALSLSRQIREIKNAPP